MLNWLVVIYDFLGRFMGIVINIKIIYVILVVGYVYVVSCLWEGDVYMYGV